MKGRPNRYPAVAQARTRPCFLFFPPTETVSGWMRPTSASTLLRTRAGVKSTWKRRSASEGRFFSSVDCLEKCVEFSTCLLAMWVSSPLEKDEMATVYMGHQNPRFLIRSHFGSVPFDECFPSLSSCYSSTS